MIANFIVFACYLVILVFIGIFFFGKTTSLPDFFLGGRRLGAPLAALSAFASDMSGWLLLSFSGAIYAYGTGQIWIAVGLALGTILNWTVVAKRLRRYSITAGSSITIPEFFENRFSDSSRLLRFVSAVFIIIFFTIYTASGFVACGMLFSEVFGIDYQIALLIGTVVVLAYTFLGGFRAVCWTDLVQALMVLFAVIALPIVTLHVLGGFKVLAERAVPGTFNILLDERGMPLSAASIVSGLAWGLGYFGMPHILIRFMAVKNEKSILPASVIAGLVVIVAMGCAVLLGLAGSVYMPGLAEPEGMYIRIVRSIFAQAGTPVPLILGGLFFCSVLAAIMSTSDSQLLVTASAIANDIYRGLTHTEHSDRHFLWFSRISVAVISVIAYIMALDKNSSVMSLVSIAWAGFGACFGSLVLLSLYWKRITLPGAAAGIISGGLTVIIWEYVLCVPLAGGWASLGQATGLYSLAPGFLISFLIIITVSVITKPPSQKVTEKFEQAAVPPIFEE
jgi:sodium/proline symporter